MNCQKGDLAVIVQSEAGNEGKIVRCIELSPNALMEEVDGRLIRIAAWRVDRLLRDFSGGFGYWINDSQLRPIRDPGPDAIDETLQRLGTPMDMRLRELENELAKLNSSLDWLEKVLTR